MVLKYQRFIISTSTLFGFAHNTGAGALKNTAQQHNAEYLLGQADHGDARRK